MIQFIHAADIHLDSPLKGLERYEGAPVGEIRQATRKALHNLVTLALDRKVDFVLIAGDLYDGDWKDHNTGLCFVREMYRLRDAGIPVVLISGNHDAASQITRSLRLPENVELLPHGKAGTATLPQLEQCGVAVHGRSFATRAETANLARDYPRKRSGLFNIGLLHTSLTGDDKGHEPYAPCSLDDLRQKEYDYWALGHIHKRQVCCKEFPVVFSGNIQGRHIRETGAKGCYVVTVDDRHQCELEFVPLDVFRWEECTVDATGTRHADEILDRFSTRLNELSGNHDGLPLAVRVHIQGQTDAHDALRAKAAHWTYEIRNISLSQTSQHIWIEKVKWNTSRVRPPLDLSDRSGAIGTLLDYLDELRSDDSLREALVAEALGDLQRKLPDELTHGDEGLFLKDQEQMRQWLGDVESLLLNRFREGGNS